MYDAIVVGARCAGSPTAMLLARTGHRVLLVDKAELPERHPVDPLHPPARCGAAPALGAARPPQSHRAARPSAPMRFDVGPFALAGAPPPVGRHRATATRRGARCSTRSCSRPPPRPAPRCASASPSTELVVDGRAGHRHPRPRRRRRRR